MNFAEMYLSQKKKLVSRENYKNEVQKLFETHIAQQYDRKYEKLRKKFDNYFKIQTSEYPYIIASFSHQDFHNKLKSYIDDVNVQKIIFSVAFDSGNFKVPAALIFLKDKVIFISAKQSILKSSFMPFGMGRKTSVEEIILTYEQFKQKNIFLLDEVVLCYEFKISTLKYFHFVVQEELITINEFLERRNQNNSPINENNTNAKLNYCPNCGSKLLEGMRFCGIWGNKIL